MPRELRKRKMKAMPAIKPVPGIAALALLFFMLASVHPAIAQGQNESTNSDSVLSGNGSLGHPGTDEFYVENGLRFTNVGVVFSRLAVQKASNGDVKNFAKDAVDKHISIGSGMVAIAKQLNVKIPAGFPPTYEADFHTLEKLSGADFDRMYLQTLIRMQHEEFGVLQAEYGPGGSKMDGYKSMAQKEADTLSRLTDQATKLEKKYGKS
jgi:predicted outer membrane protein